MSTKYNLTCQGFQGPCGMRAIRRRQSTSYVEDHANWVVLCDECHEMNEDMWRDMWDDYYSGCLSYD